MAVVQLATAHALASTPGSAAWSDPVAALEDAVAATVDAVAREDGELISLGAEFVTALFEGRGAAVRATWAVRHIRGDDAEPTGLVLAAGVHAGTFTIFEFDTGGRRQLATGSDAATAAGLCAGAAPGQIIVSEATAGHLPQSALGDAHAGGRLLEPLSDGVVDLRARVSAPTTSEPASSGDTTATSNGGVGPDETGPTETTSGGIGEATVARLHVHATDRLLHDEGPAGLGTALAELVSQAGRLADDGTLELIGPELRPDGVVLTLATPPGSQAVAAAELGELVKPLVSLKTGLPVRTGVARGVAFRGVLAEAAPTAIGPAVDLADDRARHTTGHRLTSATSDPESPLVAAIRDAIDESSERLVLLDVEGGPEATADLVHGTLLTEDVPTTTIWCSARTSASPWWTCGALVHDALDIDDQLTGPSLVEEAQRLISDVAPQVVRWLPLFATVLGTETADNAVTELLTPPFRRDRTAFVVTELLGAAWPGRRAIVIEGAQDLDDTSAGVIEMLATRNADAPWLIIRIAEGPPGANGASTTASPSTGAAASTGTSADPEHRNLRAPAEPDDRDEWTRQIDALPAGARRLLRAAAVLGPIVDTKLLTDVASETTSVAIEALDDLIGDFLVRDGPDTLRFVHPQAVEVAEAGIHAERRRQLNDSAADAIHRHRHLDRDEVRIAHLLAASRLRETWTAAVRSAQRAAEHAADIEAALLYDYALRAARVLDDGAVDIAWAWEAAGDARRRAGHLHAAEAAYAEARRHAEPDPIVGARLLRRHALVAQNDGRQPAAIRWLRRATRLLDDAAFDSAVDPSAVATGRALVSLAMSEVRARQDRHDDAAHCARSAIAASEESGERLTRARAYEALDRAYLALGDADRARHSVFALAIYEEADDLTGQADALANLAHIALLDQRPLAATRLLQRAGETLEALGDVRGSAEHQLEAAQILLDEGDLADVRRLVTEACDVFAQYRDADAVSRCHLLEERLRLAVESLDEQIGLTGKAPPGPR